MPQPVRIAGRPAAPGIAVGPIHLIARPHLALRAGGDPDHEASRLRAAIGSAIAGVESLIDAADGAGADILAFQVAMLEDEALSAPAYAAIAQGCPAAEAWSTALEREIAGYAESNDPHFKARAADLGDIRDRVLLRLAGLRLVTAAACLVADCVGFNAAWSGRKSAGAVAFQRPAVVKLGHG